MSIADEINTNNCNHTVSYNCIIIFYTHSQFYLILVGGYTFNFQFLEQDQLGVRGGRGRGWRGRRGWRGGRGRRGRGRGGGVVKVYHIYKQ